MNTLKAFCIFANAAAILYVAYVLVVKFANRGMYEDTFAAAIILILLFFNGGYLLASKPKESSV